MSPRQAERAQFGGLTLNEVLGGEKNYLGMLGAYGSAVAPSQSSDSWDLYVSAWRANNPTYQVIPEVDVYGKRETAEQQLNAAFGLNKKVTFANANPSRIEGQQSIWTSYANIAGAYRSGQIGLGDAATMAWENTKFAYQGSQRTQGAVQVINGGLEVAGATLISGTGVGAVVGLPVAFHGGDNIGTGLRRLWTGEAQNTVTYNGVAALTGSQNAAAFVDSAIPFAGGVAVAPSFAAGASDRVFQTGARQVINPNSIEAWDAADSAYDAIRMNNTDVKTIAQNVGWPEARVAAIKDHVFYDEHLLDSGMRRFDADPDIVNAWSRLTNGDFVQSDIHLLQHERFESKFESIFKTNYRTAHDAAIRSGRTWTPE